MLTENQEIIYRKGDSEISRLTADNYEKLEATLVAYIRYSQPFTKKGGILNIPRIGEEKFIRTSTIQNVERKENILVVETLNSVYEIEYKGIDLEKMLADEKFKGVNKPEDGVTPAPFPEI